MAQLNDEEIKRCTAEFRDVMAKKNTTKPNRYYESDLKRINEDDYYCHRYLNHQEWNVKKAGKAASVALKWRKEFGVQDITENDFKELLEPACNMIPFGEDKNGNENTIVFLKFLRSEERFEKPNKKLAIYITEGMDRKGMEKGLSLILDCREATLDNVNMTLVKFAVDVLMKYYPGLLRTTQVVDMPSVFESVWNLIKSMLPKSIVKTIKFVDTKTILDYTEAKYLPVELGGTVPSIKFDIKEFNERYKKA